MTGHRNCDLDCYFTQFAPPWLQCNLLNALFTHCSYSSDDNHLYANMASASASGQQPEYKYLQEISQMVSVSANSEEISMFLFQMFVFGDVVDPHPDVLKLVEDIVRNQVIEMVSGQNPVEAPAQFGSFCNRVRWPIDEARDTCLPRISSS